MDEVKEMFQQIKSKLDMMDGKLEILNKEMKELKQENAELKAKTEKQEQRMEILEREIRRKNLVIKGICDDENEEKIKTEMKVETMLQKIGVKIDQKTDIDEVRRIGRYQTETKRPILLKLMKESKRTEILSKAKGLKGTEIWIDQDYPKEVQKERKELIPQLIEARQKGYMAQLRYNKLIINKEVFYAKNNYQNENLNTNKEEEEESSNKNYKRTIAERSPDGDTLADQLKKIIKTSDRKN